MARSISAGAIPDKFDNTWQYHPRSDRHSRIACWGVMFDLLRTCPLLRQHFADGKVGFGINHELTDFTTGRTKVLDLVVCTPRQAKDSKPRKPEFFHDLVDKHGVVLTTEEKQILAGFPLVPVVPVGNVNLALEAKATMTAHIRALPRLHDELDSSHTTVHGDTDAAIAAALVTINTAGKFLSPDNNKRRLIGDNATWNSEPQPKSTERTMGKVREIRRRSGQGSPGFDAMGIVLIDFKNDGSPCEIVIDPPAPSSTDSDHYANMIGRISTLYGSRFASF
jgi:hypothetical protein